MVVSEIIRHLPKLWRLTAFAPLTRLPSQHEQAKQMNVSIDKQAVGI